MHKIIQTIEQYQLRHTLRKLEERARFGYEVKGYAMHPETYNKLREALDPPDVRPQTFYSIPVYIDANVSRTVVEVLSEKEIRKRGYK